MVHCLNCFRNNKLDIKMIKLGQRIIKCETQEVLEWDGNKWKSLGYFNPIYRCIVPSKNYDIKYPEKK